MWRIAVLPGDGIGPEVLAEGVKVMEVVGRLFGHRFEFVEGLIGGAALDQYGDPLPDATLDLVRQADAVLFGAVGGPKWDDGPPERRPGKGLQRLRRELDLYANLRPILLFPSLSGTGPIRREVTGERLDVMIVRELTSGLYFGQPKGLAQDDAGRRVAVDTMRYSDEEARRLLRVAFRIARGRLGSVVYAGKKTVLACSQLWWDVAQEVAQEFPEVQLEYMNIDACALHLLRNPRRFDVIATTNHAGDILSELAGVLAASLGMVPSASLGDGGPGLFEPIHGSAPDLAGQGVANPIGMILSVALCLEYGLGLTEEASAVRAAVERALEEGVRTADIAQPGTRVVGTREMGAAIVRQLETLAG